MKGTVDFQIWPEGEDFAIAAILQYSDGTQELASLLAWESVFLGDVIEPTIRLTSHEAQALVDKMGVCGIVAARPVSARNEEARQLIKEWLAEDAAAPEPPLEIEPFQLRSHHTWGDDEGMP